MSDFEGGLPDFRIDAARALIAECNDVRNSNANETVVRQTLIAQLSDVFPSSTRPWWVISHIRGAESQLNTLDQGGRASHYADSLVGMTAIEYKADLRRKQNNREGLRQLRSYAAGLVNDGYRADACRCVLSDGVEWRAFSIVLVCNRKLGQYGVDDVELSTIEQLICAGEEDAKRLIAFLTMYLGREQLQPLTGMGISYRFGLESALGRECVQDITAVIDECTEIDANSAEMVFHVRRQYDSYLGTGRVDLEEGATYARECHLAIVARLICANALARRALHSPSDELDHILDGSYFSAMGLRLVDRDQFDWIFRKPGVLRSVASKVQSELIAYDFWDVSDDDLFGQLLASLADPVTRILLGQACTPVWLSLEMARRLMASLPKNEWPRFVDMCCGSGAMLVATTRLVRRRLADTSLVPKTLPYIEALAAAATGFDINPLAVLLARINWIISNRDVLPLDGSISVSPPIYHADSLFALAPVFAKGHNIDKAGQNIFKLDNITIKPPRFLLEPPARVLFEELLERCRNLGDLLAEDRLTTVSNATAVSAVQQAAEQAEVTLDRHSEEKLAEFCAEFVNALARLEERGRDGVWSYVLGNSYRPVFFEGRFNGILSNPPWLAMSKIGSNPFRPIVERLARQYGLVPGGSSAHHLDMSTVFLAYAIDRYLKADGLVACILPDTVRNGQHHKPFREIATGRHANDKLTFSVDEIWRLDKNTFGNTAAVLMGRKTTAEQIALIRGRRLSQEESEETMFAFRSSGSRTAWCEHEGVVEISNTYSGVAAQGADVMPRRLVFFDVASRGQDRVLVAPILQESDSWQLVSRAKKHSSFVVQSRHLPARFAHPCLLSIHLAPFALADPSRAILPVVRERFGWRPVTREELAIAPRAHDHFRDVVAASDFGSLEAFWEALDMRHKLSNQQWHPRSWLVVYAAGGGIPAAAFARVGEHSAIVDQTLYGFAVTSEDEALYFCGVINSRALRRRVACFVPEGKFGGRHLHTLPQDETPAFDPTDETHSEIVASTRELIRELDACKREPDLAELFGVRIDLNVRRRRLRELIASLPAFPRYDTATHLLYTK